MQREDKMTLEKSMKRFTAFWFSQTLSEVGGAVNIFAITIYITQVMYTDPSEKAVLAFAIAANNIAYNLAYILSQPFVGVWTDRLDRKKILLYCNYTAGFLTLILFMFMYTENLSLIMILCYSFILGIIKSFIISSFTASIVMIVPEKHLSRANGMTQTSFSLSQTVAPTIATFLISLPSLLDINFFSLQANERSISIPILLDGLTFLLSAVILGFLHIASPRNSANITARKSFLTEVKNGLTYFNTSFVWLLMVIAVGNLLIPVISMLYPILIRYNLSGELITRGLDFKTGLAIITTLGSVGGLCGGIAISIFGGLKRKRIYGVIVPLIFSGIFMILFGLSSHIYLTGIIASFIFFMLPITTTHSSTIWQLGTPKEVQGMVFSVRRFISQMTLPLSGVLAGFIGSEMNPGVAISILGLILAVFNLVQLFNKKLISIEEHNINVNDSNNAKLNG